MSKIKIILRVIESIFDYETKQFWHLNSKIFETDSMLNKSRKF